MMLVRFSRALGRPFTLPLVVFGLLLVLTTLGRGLVDSVLTRLDEAKSVHRDRSRFDAGVERQVPSRVAIVVEGEGGERRRVLADADQYAAFVRAAFEDLEAARLAAGEEVGEIVAARVAPIEAGAHGRVDAYADWYYAWSTTYRILYEATRSALQHALEPGVMSLEDSVSADLGRYLRDQYEVRVLEPEYTDARLREAYAAARRELHGRYLDAVARLERDLQTFVAERTTHLEADHAVAVARVEIDWASQLHKLKTASQDKGGLGAITRAGGITAFGLAGRRAGSAILAGTTTRGTAIGVNGGRLTLRGLGARLTGPLAGKATTATGTTAGTALGGPLGAAVGAGAGLLVDYAVNEGTELVGRTTFEHDVHRAVDAGFAAWHSAMTRDLRAAVDIWFDDTIQLLPAGAAARGD